MVKVIFYCNKGMYRGFTIKGHAGGKFGQNIVCAAISSAVMLTINTISDFLHADTSVVVKENAIAFRINNYEEEKASRAVLFALRNHIQMIMQDYKGIDMLIRDTL